ncbi:MULTISPECIES: class I SAM-dependent methyltransferase [Clostridium]|uniref:Class I SAM-dependent methyltransferase n=1 Tax=Clostridium aquiflavi TaxID=3073603 RepID=A0ABU1EKA6_9CLOT|nr:MULTISPECIES: class I SAM-dependent methyltransferase [unclassified Clostridium]MDR5588497.1 class I SAM-dependent methyltransferase [Clostridium sp. 5N-1]
MDDLEFFNSVAFKWDEMCKHDDKKIRRIIELSDIKSGSKILDVGTGTGILISYLLEKSPTKIVAVDNSENMIKVCKSKYNDKRVEFIVNDIMNLENYTFDYIFIYSAYPHFKDKYALFNKLYNLLNKDGKIVIAHSDSKEKINNVHLKKPQIKYNVLPPVENTIIIMNNYFYIDKSIDNEEMYYVSGIK